MTMFPYEDRVVAFDSNVLTYFLDGNRGSYQQSPGDPLADQRIAAVRLFLHCRPFITPTVRAEATAIPNSVKLEEHLRFIQTAFGELIPDERQIVSIESRTQELLSHHEGENDCRIVAEDGDVPVLVTFDRHLVRDLSPHTNLRLESPVKCWDSFGLHRGTPPVWTPAPGHPLHNEAWWRWE